MVQKTIELERAWSNWVSFCSSWCIDSEYACF